jgi:hypothetical protein
MLGLGFWNLLAWICEFNFNIPHKLIATLYVSMLIVPIVFLAFLLCGIVGYFSRNH